MLPTFTSLNTDNPLSDAGSGKSLKTLSAGTSEPTAVFAGELRRSALALKPEGTGRGESLPVSGNGLPPGFGNAQMPPEFAELPADELQTLFADLEDLARLSGHELNLTPIQALATRETSLVAEHPSMPLEPDVLDLREGWKGAGTPVAPVLVDYSKDLDLLQPDDLGASIKLTDISLRADGSIPPDALDPRVKLPPGLDLAPARETAVPVVASPAVLQRQAAGLAADGKATAIADSAAGTRAVADAAVQRSLQDGGVAADRPIAVSVEEKLLDAHDRRSRGPVLPVPSRESGGENAQQIRAPLLTTESVSRFETVGSLSEGLRQDAASLTRTSGSPVQFTTATTQPTGPQATTPELGLAQSNRTLTDTLATSVRDPSWGDRVSERVVMMANNRLQNAELRLTPAELGPLRVKVSMEDGLANVSFVATHSATRDALEQAMPKLRSMLEEQGINLGQSSVDEQATGGAFGQDSDTDSGTQAASADAEPQSGERAESAEPETTRRTSSGLLDTFA